MNTIKTNYYRILTSTIMYDKTLSFKFYLTLIYHKIRYLRAMPNHCSLNWVSYARYKKFFN
jgi:hypothetical protein